MLSIIVAYDKNQGIGIKNSLPWKLSDDLKNFKKITKNNYIVMGRKTFDSIGFALPNRKNIILTRQKEYTQISCTVLHETEHVVNLAKENPYCEVFVIGGAEIYQAFLSFVDRLYITKVQIIKEADTFFPTWQKNQFKRIAFRDYKKNDKNECNFNFEIWERILRL